MSRRSHGTRSCPLLRAAALLAASLVAAPEATAGIIDLGLVPGSLTVERGKAFGLAVRATSDAPIAAVFFDVTFDPALLTVTSVELDPALTFFPSRGSVDPVNGFVSLIGGGSVSGFGGDGEPADVATLHFQALQEVGAAEVALAFTTEDECALVGGGALGTGDLDFGSAVVTVPEPANLALVATAVLGALEARRRRAGRRHAAGRPRRRPDDGRSH